MKLTWHPTEFRVIPFPAFQTFCWTCPLQIGVQHKVNFVDISVRRATELNRKEKRKAFPLHRKGNPTELFLREWEHYIVNLLDLPSVDFASQNNWGRILWKRFVSCGNVTRQTFVGELQISTSLPLPHIFSFLFCPNFSSVSFLWACWSTLFWQYFPFVPVQEAQISEGTANQHFSASATHFSVLSCLYLFSVSFPWACWENWDTVMLRFACALVVQCLLFCSWLVNVHTSTFISVCFSGRK